MCSDVYSHNDRKFPFKTTKQKKDVESALKLFEVLWHSHENRRGKLSTSNMEQVFHNCISDALSYADGGWRRGKYWSPEAWKMACDAGKHSGLGLICEHVIPRTCVLKYSMETLETYEAAETFVKSNSFVCVITKDQDRMLNSNHRSSHPMITDPWLRYADHNIRVLNIPNFLNQDDIDSLNRHRLLVNL